MTLFRKVLLAACLTWPWLNPFSSGPSASVISWLVSGACVGLVLVQIPLRRYPQSVILFLVFIVSAVSLRTVISSSDMVIVWYCLLIFGAAVGVGVWAGAKAEFLRVLASAWVCAGVFGSIAALLQYAGWADNFYPWVSASMDGTPYGNLRQRNQMATLTVIGLSALVWLVQTNTPQPARDNNSSGVRVGALVGVAGVVCAVAAMAVVNAFTGSRTGLLQLLSLVVFSWFIRRSMTALGRFVVVWAVCCFCAGTAVQAWAGYSAGGVDGHALARMSAEVELGCSSRIALWANVWDLVLQRPWIGWGWRELAWAHYYADYSGEPAARFCAILDNAHNLPLHLAVELGVPAAFCFTAWLVYGAWRGATWTSAQSGKLLAWAVLWVVALHSMVEFPLWYGPFMITAGITVGLIANPKLSDTLNGQGRGHNLSIAAKSIGVVLVASSLLLSWQYHRVSQIYLPESMRDPGFRAETLSKIGWGWPFEQQVEFARLVTTRLTVENVIVQRNLAIKLMHFSPEPRVIEALIESASIMGDTDTVRSEMLRYREVFPADYLLWTQRNVLAKLPSP